MSTCLWATISGTFQPKLVEWWLSRGEWGKRLLPSSSLGLGPAGTGWGLCPAAPEPSPRPPTGLAQASRWWWTSPWALPLQHNGGGRLHGTVVWGTWFLPFGRPEEPEGWLVLGTWLPQRCSWAGSGDRTLRELPPETCFLSARAGPQGESCPWGPCPYLSEQRITFIW